MHDRQLHLRFQQQFLAKATRTNGGNRTYTVLITPAMAAEILNANYDNRPLRKHTILFLARQMREGLWKLNGESIKFDKNGRLIDGQHRLYACIESGCSFLTDVRIGLDPEAYITIGVGVKKTTSDFLAADKEKNANVLASALSWLWRIERENVITNKERPSAEEAHQLLDKNPGMRDSAARVGNFRHYTSQSMAAALHYLFSQRDQTLVETLFARLHDGLGLADDDPIYRLRERLIANRAAKAKLPLEEVGALMVKAWNLLRHDRKIRAVRWSRDEGFPAIQ